jgi:hypothetical protein
MAGYGWVWLGILGTGYGYDLVPWYGSIPVWYQAGDQGLRRMDQAPKVDLTILEDPLTVG